MLIIPETTDVCLLLPSKCPFVLYTTIRLRAPLRELECRVREVSGNPRYYFSV